MLKAGRDTGSLMNHLYSRMTKGQPEPVVGMGATLLGWTDRDPGTVIEVIKTKRGVIVAVQEDTAQRTDKNGFSESQEYEYSANPNGRIEYFRYEEGNGWRGVSPGKKLSSWKLNGGKGLRIGEREKYHDFSF
jgi:hypothetical protein